MPVTAAGVKAIEEATAAGVSVNATVSFTCPQALAVADAVERGLKRRESEGKDTSKMTPVCTIMVGRMDDWLKVIQKKENIAVTPGVLDWAGVAVFKMPTRYIKNAVIKPDCLQLHTEIIFSGASLSAATLYLLSHTAGRNVLCLRHRSKRKNG